MVERGVNVFLMSMRDVESITLVEKKNFELEDKRSERSVVAAIDTA